MVWGQKNDPQNFRKKINYLGISTYLLNHSGIANLLLDFFLQLSAQPHLPGFHKVIPLPGILCHWNVCQHQEVLRMATLELLAIYHETARQAASCQMQVTRDLLPCDGRMN